MASEAEAKALICAAILWSRFSDRILRLSEGLRDVFFSDLDAAMDSRLKALESAR